MKTHKNFKKYGSICFLWGIMPLVLAACSTPAPTTYDLSAAQNLQLGKGRGLVIISEPNVLQAYDSTRLVIRTREGTLGFVPDLQWADRLPRLLQARLVQTLENGGRIASVGKPGERLSPTRHVTLDIRAFEIDAASSEAVVTIGLRMIDDHSGKVLGGQVFSARTPAGENPAHALDTASQQVLTQIARWISNTH